MLLVCSFFIWRFLLKNSNNFCAFDVMLFMCTFHVMLDEIVIPRYFVVSTDSSGALRLRAKKPLRLRATFTGRITGKYVLFIILQ